MKRAPVKTVAKAELTPAMRKEIISLSNKKDVTAGLKAILSDYKRYKKVEDKIEAAFKN